MFSTFFTFFCFAYLHASQKYLAQESKVISVLSNKFSEMPKLKLRSWEELDEIYNKASSKIRENSLSFMRLKFCIAYMKLDHGRESIEAGLKKQDEWDQNVAENQMVPVRFLIWFIPILGFIGTVIGISEAIIGFNTILNATSNFQEMKQSLGGVTESLGFAFDTTLVALIQDALIMLYMSICQKKSDQFLAEVEKLFHGNLLLKIPAESSAVTVSGSLPDEKLLDILNELNRQLPNLNNLEYLSQFSNAIVEISESFKTLLPAINRLNEKKKWIFSMQEQSAEG